MKIGILDNISKEKTKETLSDFQNCLQKCGYETVYFSGLKEIDDVDVMIVLGGDGAILHAAVPAAQKHIPIIGINYGNLGFLTEYEKSEREKVQELLSLFREKKCRIVKRSVLEVVINGESHYALNEIAIQRNYGSLAEHGGQTQILKLQIEGTEGADLLCGDGVLFCTPTGSTAYSLSAGGAILTPEVPVIMMTPICAFSMRARPIVFSDSDVFSVKNIKGNAVIVVDGKAINILEQEQEIYIKKAPFTADFPVKNDSDFFTKVRKKLND